jgi:hypothetical protein
VPCGSAPFALGGLATEGAARDAVRMHPGPSRHDRLGAAMLAGALVGLVAGAIEGLRSQDLAAPVVWPFAGALAGVLVAALVVASVGVVSGAGRVRRAADQREREQIHARLRLESHRGWPEGIDLVADAPPRSREE